MIELKAGEVGKLSPRDRTKAGGTILIVAVPEDEEVSATISAGAEPEGNRPRPILDSRSGK